MAREEVDAVYIGSNDFWGFDSDTFNEETNFLWQGLGCSRKQGYAEDG